MTGNDDLNQTATMLLGEFTPREIEQLIAIVKRFKHRFASVSACLFAAADEVGLRREVVHVSITCECLLLAAHMHLGTYADFLNAARAALDDAEHERPLPDVALQ